MVKAPYRTLPSGSTTGTKVELSKTKPPPGRAEGLDARHQVAVGLGDLVDRAAEARDVDGVAHQSGVEDGLHIGTGHRERDRHGLPVAREAPHLRQMAVRPAQLLLVPGLGVPGRYAREHPRLELHVDV